MKPAGNKEINKVLKFAEQNGFVEVRRGNHIVMKRQDMTVVISISPSCRYGAKNARKDIEKCLQRSCTSIHP